MKKSKGYRMLAIIYGILSLMFGSAMFAASALELPHGTVVAAFGSAGVITFFCAIWYDLKADAEGRREWRTIR